MSETRERSGWTRRNLAMQGFGTLDESGFRACRVGVKTVPAFALVGVIAGLASGWPPLMFAWAAILAIGAILRKNPVDQVYNHGLRYLTGGRDLGPTPAPRRFSAAFAAVMFVALGAALAFDAGPVILIALGVPMLISPSVILLTNWCLPAFFYTRILHLNAWPLRSGSA